MTAALANDDPGEEELEAAAAAISQMGKPASAAAPAEAEAELAANKALLPSLDQADMPRAGEHHAVADAELDARIQQPQPEPEPPGAPVLI